jgi:hypothetical protein
MVFVSLARNGDVKKGMTVVVGTYRAQQARITTGCPFPWTLSAYEFPLGNSEYFLCFMLVNPSKIVPPPGVPLRQIQFVVFLCLQKASYHTWTHFI